MDRKQVLLDDGQMARQREFTEKIHDIHRARGRTPLAMVDTFGCQQNVADSQHILGMLRDMGCDFTDDPARADIVVMNTCAIRDHAEKRVYGTLGALTHTKKANPEQIICLCGCMAQRPEVAQRVRESYRHVDLVFGPQALWKFPELLYRVYTRRGRVFSVENEHGSIAEGMPVVREGRVRAWVSIMYGCNNFCTYCIVPYVRGREKSRKPGDILAEFRSLVEAGYKEITLLGQNVNSYGKGLEEQIDFSDLLNLLCTVPGDYHIRFLTVDFDKALQATGVFGGHLVQNHRSAAGGQIIVAGDIAKCAVADIIAAVIKDGAIGADVEVAVQVMGDTGGIRLFNIDNRGAGRVRIACGVGINYRRG